MYKNYANNQFFGEIKGVRRLVDNVFIPFDPANTDYQAYLKWLDAGNTPEAADDKSNAAPSQEG